MDSLIERVRWFLQANISENDIAILLCETEDDSPGENPGDVWLAIQAAKILNRYEKKE